MDLFTKILKEAYFKTARSGGAGGQHVNKTETKVEFYWNITKSYCIDEKKRIVLLTFFKNRIDKEGVLKLSASKSRSQLANKTEVIKRFKNLLDEALKVEKTRIPTKISKAKKQKRLDSKKRKGQTKSNRKRIDPSRFLGFLLLISMSVSYGQQINAPRLYSKIIAQQNRDSLRHQLGCRKEFLPQFELASLVALTHYPELINVRISFREKKLHSTMATRPKGIEVLRKKGKREYIVYINTTDNVNVPIDQTSFNAQVGVIGHELAHIVDYESKSSIRLIANGLGYLSKGFRLKLEHQTDKSTISHGLGWQLYDWSFYVLHYEEITPKYLEYKKKIYLKPSEIESLLQKN